MDQTLTIIIVIVGIFNWIVFLVMASNVGQILKNLKELKARMDTDYPKSFSVAYIEGVVKTKQGKEKEAIEALIESYYLADRQSKLTPKTHDWTKVKAEINDRIAELGGNKQEY